MKTQWRYEAGNVAEWPICLYVVEEDGMTVASATLGREDGPLASVGVSRRHPDDDDVPVIGDDLAAGRALVALGHQLIGRSEAALGERQEER